MLLYAALGGCSGRAARPRPEIPRMLYEPLKGRVMAGRFTWSRSTARSSAGRVRAPRVFLIRFEFPRTYPNISMDHRDDAAHRL